MTKSGPFQMAPLSGPAFSKKFTVLNEPSPVRWERVPQSTEIGTTFGAKYGEVFGLAGFQRPSFGPVSVQCKFSKMSSKPDFLTPFPLYIKNIRKFY